MTAFARVLRAPVRTGRAGRPRLVPTAGLRLGQVIKHHAGRHLVSMTRRVVWGTAEAITAVLAATGTGTGINTASIARLNATFRSALSPLARRGRASIRDTEALSTGMDLVGGASTCCWTYDSLRIAANTGQPRTWPERTPALAAGLTDHWRSLSNSRSVGTRFDVKSQQLPVTP